MNLPDSHGSQLIVRGYLEDRSSQLFRIRIKHVHIYYAHPQLIILLGLGKHNNSLYFIVRECGFFWVDRKVKVKLFRELFSTKQREGFCGGEGPTSHEYKERAWEKKIISEGAHIICIELVGWGKHSIYGNTTNVQMEYISYCKEVESTYNMVLAFQRLSMAIKSKQKTSTTSLQVVALTTQVN